jgi:hypothetical protein
VPAVRKGTHEGCPYTSCFGRNVHGGDGKPSPPTAKGLADIGVQANETCTGEVALDASGRLFHSWSTVLDCALMAWAP